ncbi:MAG: hypothetical protein IBX70_09140 [Clostridia bacterium]|nr:hypothetical protein [Clostridia bacterium]
MKSSVYIKEIEYYKKIWDNHESEPPLSVRIPFHSKLNLYIRLKYKINKFFKNLIQVIDKTPV